LRVSTESSREVASLTIHTLRILEHAEEEACFAQKAVLLRARTESVAFSEGADGREVVKRLKEGVGVRVGDVGFETGVRSLVVEAVRGERSVRRRRANGEKDEREVEIFDSESTVLDLDLAVVLRHLSVISRFLLLLVGRRSLQTEDQPQRFPSGEE
jgi:hypothetical protein